MFQAFANPELQEKKSKKSLSTAGVLVLVPWISPSNYFLCLGYRCMLSLEMEGMSVANCSMDLLWHEWRYVVLVCAVPDLFLLLAVLILVLVYFSHYFLRTYAHSKTHAPRRLVFCMIGCMANALAFASAEGTTAENYRSTSTF